MLDKTKKSFARLNRAYNSVFQPDRLSIGLVVPIENYDASPVPQMGHHLERAQKAEALGFSSLWLRDVPFNVPSFGDAGQIFDPFVYLGFLAGRTEKIALGVASIVLPLRHPAHIAKAAASADVLSGGRVLLGIASGDRPDEYPALSKDYANRGARFRDSVEYMEQISADFPSFDNAYGTLAGTIDLLPKPVGEKIPLLITGGSQQDPKWIAEHGDGWMTYPRSARAQSDVISNYRRSTFEAGGPDKPVMQSLYFDLSKDEKADPEPIHLGFRSGVKFLAQHLRQLQGIGVNHVALNLRFNTADMDETLETLSRNLLPEFSKS